MNCLEEKIARTEQKIAEKEEEAKKADQEGKEEKWKILMEYLTELQREKILLEQLKGSVKVVRFKSFHVSVTHWQTLNEIKMEVAYDMTLNEFERDIKIAFDQDIHESVFRIYRLPKDFHLIEERRKISTDEEFRGLLQEFNDPRNAFPLIYVWNEEDQTSPTQLPKKIIGDPLETLSQSTDVSTEYKYSVLTRERDGDICLLCCLAGRPNLQACHIFERKHLKNMNNEQRKAKLDELKLIEINDIRNMITLCHNCHDNFDNQLIGLDSNFRFHVTPAIQSKIANFFTHQKYEELNGKQVTFEQQFKAVTVEAVTHRWTNYFMPVQYDKFPIAGTAARTISEEEE